ncbi:MAG: fructosamine kinase family protein, partial [Plesiomonas shigelloides]
FYRAYERVSPLPNGYQDRKSVYQLYHLLNFCNLFGGHYLEQTQKAIDDLLQNNY